MINLFKKIKELEERIKDLEDPIVGTYYFYFPGMGFYPPGYEWSIFRKSNIQDGIDGYMKIDGKWCNKENVILYTDLKGFDNKLKKSKQKIEKRCKEENK